MKLSLNEKVESNALNLSLMALLRFEANIMDRSNYDGVYRFVLS